MNYSDVNEDFEFYGAFGEENSQEDCSSQYISEDYPTFDSVQELILEKKKKKRISWSVNAISFIYIYNHY